MGTGTGCRYLWDALSSSLTLLCHLDVGYYADNMLVNPKQEDSAQVAANETVDDTEAQQTIMIIQGQDGNYEEKDGFLVQSGQVSFTQYRSP